MRKRFAALRSFIEKRWSALNIPGPLNRFFFLGAKTNSGVAVNENTALTFGAVYSCVTLLAQTLAMLPLILYRREGEGKKRATDHYLYDRLHTKPSSTMNRFTWVETLQGGVLLNGNGMAPIIRDRLGRIQELPVVMPGDVTVYRDHKGVFYKITGDSPYTGLYDRADMFHPMNFSRDGLRGLSPITLFREAIGLGLACEEFGGLFFGNGTNPGLVVSHPNTLSDTAWKHLKESIREKSEGLWKSHLMMLLEEGMRVEKYGTMPLDDAQFLATRSFQKSEICGIYKVPPHMIGDVEKSTSWGTGIEQQQIGFVTYSLLQWLVRWEMELNDKLLTDREREQGFFFEFLVDGLLRGDAKARAEALNIQRRAGIINGNEWRAKENMNPVEGGETYLCSMDLAPIGSIIDGTARQKTTPAPAAGSEGAQQ